MGGPTSEQPLPVEFAAELDEEDLEESSSISDSSAGSDDLAAVEEEVEADGALHSSLGGVDAPATIDDDQLLADLDRLGLF